LFAALERQFNEADGVHGFFGFNGQFLPAPDGAGDVLVKGLITSPPRFLRRFAY
jgi:hypothetical protein